MALQDLIRWLLPREDHFFDYLEQQADVAHEAAQAMARFREDGMTAEKLTEAVSELEHRGDAVVGDIEDALARTFVTPIDREDIHKLSNDLDDVVDLMNLAARTCHLLGVDRPTQPMLQLIDTLVEATRQIKEAVPMLRRRAYGHLTGLARTLRQLEKDGDQTFRQALKQLFQANNLDVRQLLREKEVLEDLENAIDCCDHVAETLGSLAIKHG